MQTSKPPLYNYNIQGVTAYLHLDTLYLPETCHMSHSISVHVLKAGQVTVSISFVYTTRSQYHQDQGQNNTSATGPVPKVCLA